MGARAPMRTLLVFIFFLLLLGSQTWATQTTLSPALIEDLNFLNDSQLLEAYSNLQDYTAKNPEDPAGLFLLALTKWRIMWISSYNADDRKELTGLMERVQQICNPRTEDKDCLFLNASVIGMYAQLAATENQWWETAQLGKKMKSQAEKILKMDEEYYPAYYLLGSFNYFADALPGYLKFLRTLVFLPGGDRNTGLRQLNVSYQKGGVASGEAGRTLAMIYTYYERNPEYGVKMCDNLHTLFPQAYDVSFYRGINLYFGGSWQQSVDQLKSLQASLIAYSAKHESPKEQQTDKKEIIPVYRPMEREARYWIGRNLIQMENYSEARDVLMELTDPTIHQPYWLVRYACLSLAQIEYLNHNDRAAEVWLDKVMAWKDLRDSRDKAKILRKKQGKLDKFEIDVR